MLEVLAVKPGTAAIKGGSDDEGIIETVSVACLDVDAALVQALAGHDPPEGREHSFQVVSCRCVIERDGRLAQSRVETLLYNLVADAGVSGLQGGADDLVRNSVFFLSESSR